MRRIIFTVFFILFSMCVEVSAQTASFKRSFENGMAAAQSKDFETALTEFKSVVQIAKTENVRPELLAKIHYNIGVCLYRTGRQEQAVGELEMAIRNDKTYEKAYYALGMAEAEKRNWDAAKTAFLQAIAINRRNGETWFDLGYVFLELTDLEAAREAFERSTKYKSIDSAIGHNNVGVILAMKGDFLQANAEFERAVRESGGSLVAARNNLIVCRQLRQTADKILVGKLEIAQAQRRIGD